MFVPSCALSAPLPQVEDSMLAMLFAYRKKCASDSPAGQLILPEGLRVLPLFTLCTHKMLALRPNHKVGLVRVWITMRVLGGPFWTLPTLRSVFVRCAVFAVVGSDPVGGLENCKKFDFWRGECC